MELEKLAMVLLVGHLDLLLVRLPRPPVSCRDWRYPLRFPLRLALLLVVARCK